MSRRSSWAAPDNQAMSFRLAQAVAEDPGVSPNNAIVAAGLFAIAASMDRLHRFFDELAREDRAKERAKGVGQ